MNEFVITIDDVYEVIETNTSYSLKDYADVERSASKKEPVIHRRIRMETGKKVYTWHIKKGFYRCVCRNPDFLTLSQEKILFEPLPLMTNNGIFLANTTDASTPYGEFHFSMHQVVGGTSVIEQGLVVGKLYLPYGVQ